MHFFPANTGVYARPSAYSSWILKTMNVTLPQSATITTTVHSATETTTTRPINTTTGILTTTPAASTVSSSTIIQAVQAVQVISKYNTPFITDYNDVSSSASQTFISNYKAFVIFKLKILD